MESASSSISTAVVRLMHEHTGRGPTNSRTRITPEVIVVLLRDCLNPSELRLINEGQHAVVWQLRRAFQAEMREAMIAIVEAATDQGVEAFLTDVSLDPDITVDIFVMQRSD